MIAAVGPYPITVTPYAWAIASSLLSVSSVFPFCIRMLKCIPGYEMQWMSRAYWDWRTASFHIMSAMRW